MATFSVIVSGDRDSNSTHAACVLVEARNCSDSCFCFRCLKVGAEHSQLSAHGWSRSSERKEQVFGFHGLSDAPNTHFVHSVADFNTPSLYTTCYCVLVLVFARRDVSQSHSVHDYIHSQLYYPLIINDPAASGVLVGRKEGRRCGTWAGCPTPSRWLTTAPPPHRARRPSTPTRLGASRRLGTPRRYE